MAVPVIRGSLAPFLQNQVWDFDPQRGYVYRADFKGISQEEMLALQETYVDAGIACKLTYHQGDTCSLEIEDSTQAYTVDSWQMVGNEESRDGLSHPALFKALADVVGRPYDVIADMRKALAEQMTTEEAFASGQPLNGAPALCQKFYELQIRGQTEYLASQYVLRHVTNAPNRWTENISDIGIDKVYTPAQLLSEAQDSSLWKVPMPGRLAYKISAIPAPDAITDYLWGWLKKSSTETTAANNRIDITTEYVLYQWPIETYYKPL